jgi:SAM-dependent methyltransferase
MTPSSSIAVKLSKNPARLASFALQTIWAGIVLISVCVLWAILFLLFLPFLIVGELLGWNRDAARNSAPETTLGGVPSPQIGDASVNPLIFDRRRDVSKLFGCNTRSVRYRWAIFSERLASIKNQVTEPNALDFGAGSLRDSFELSKLGFNVVSVDLDKSVLQSYYDSYDWDEVTTAPQVFTDGLDDLVQQTGPNRFHLAIAFDVIEHLEDPDATVRKIGSLLHERGLFFTIVPNRKSIFERYFKHHIRRYREKGLTWTPGVPHLQFKDPGEWDRFFESNGFKVLEHDMAIGFLVNNTCAVLGLPIRVWVAPVLAMFAHVFHRKFDAFAFEKAFLPAWLMERVHPWDMKLKKLLWHQFGWNLIVAQRNS